MKKLYLIIMLCVPLKSVAGIDPGRVAAIELASDQAKKTIESQEKAQLLMTTGHVWGSHDRLPARVQRLPG